MWVLTCRSSVATQIEAAAGSRGEKANTHTHTHTHTYTDMQMFMIYWEGRPQP